MRINARTKIHAPPQALRKTGGQIFLSFVSLELITDVNYQRRINTPLNTRPDNIFTTFIIPVSLRQLLRAIMTRRLEGWEGDGVCISNSITRNAIMNSPKKREEEKHSGEIEERKGENI